MWDKHRQIRQHSRKRAMRAARVRAGERGGAPGPGATRPLAPEDTTEPEPLSAENEPDSSGKPVHDPASRLAWTGLILLTLLLGGFVGAAMFMLG